MTKGYEDACGAAARVGDFNGKTLSTISSSTVIMDEDDVEGVAAMRAWFKDGGSLQVAQPLSAPGKGGRVDRRVTVRMINDEVRAPPLMDRRAITRVAALPVCLFVRGHLSAGLPAHRRSCI